MRKTYLTILTFIGIFALVAGVAYAYFSSRATVPGNVLGTGTAKLLVTGTDGGDWVESLPSPLGTLENLYPGWTGSYEVYFKNASTIDVTLAVMPTVEVVGEWNGLVDDILLTFKSPDNVSIGGPWPLRAWTDASNPVITNLTENATEGPWTVDLSVANGATTQGKSIEFNLLFNGEQVH